MLGSHISERALSLLEYDIGKTTFQIECRTPFIIHFIVIALELEDDFQTQDMTIISLLNMKHSICAV